MYELQPCLDAMPVMSAKCNNMSDEISDVGNYINYITSQWAGTPATSVFVAFHNLVTDSISRPAEYIQGGVKTYYCAAQVTQGTGGFDSDLQANILQPSAPGVPGISTSHRLLSC